MVAGSSPARGAKLSYLFQHHSHMARVAFLVALRGQGNGMPLTSADLVLLQETIERCVQVIDSHSLQKGEVWRREAAFIYLMIYLNDLLQTLKRLDHRIGFTDDVVIKHQTERGGRNRPRKSGEELLLPYKVLVTRNGSRQLHPDVHGESGSTSISGRRTGLWQ